MSGRAVRRLPAGGYATNSYFSRPVTRPKYRTRNAQRFAATKIQAAWSASRRNPTRARKARSYRLKKMTMKRKFPGGLGIYMSKFLKK